MGGGGAPARRSRDPAPPSHPSMNLKVQQLAKEQRQCRTAVSTWEEPGAGVGSWARRSPGGGREGQPSGPPPALPPSCSRRTASSAGGSLSTTSVSGGTWARQSSRCRWGSSLRPGVPGMSSPPKHGPPGGPPSPSWVSGPPGAERVKPCSERVWDPSSRPSRTRRPTWTGYGRRRRRPRRRWPPPGWSCGSRPRRVGGARGARPRAGLGRWALWSAPPSCPHRGGGGARDEVPGH